MPNGLLVFSLQKYWPQGGAATPRITYGGPVAPLGYFFTKVAGVFNDKNLHKLKN